MEEIIKTNEIKPKKNYCLSFFEALACCLIVFIHIKFPGIFGEIMRGLARFGVPLFFVIGGFYLYKDGMSKIEVRKKLKKRILHLINLLIFTAIIYFALNITLSSVVPGRAGAKQYIIDTFNWIRLAQFFGFNRPFINDISWFMVAMICSYLIIMCFPDLFTKNKWFVYVVAAMSLVCIGFRLFVFKTRPTWFGMSVSTPFIYRSWFASGLPFIALGIALKRNEKLLLKIPLKVAVISLIAIVPIMVGEVFFVKYVFKGTLSYNIGNIICVCLMIVLSIQRPLWFSKLKLLNLPGTWSTYVYIFHFGLAQVAKIVFKLGSTKNEIIKWTAPLMVLTLALIMAISFTLLLNKLQKIIKRKREKKFAGNP